MTALVLDAGALIAVDRGDRDVQRDIQDALRAGTPVRTNANAVAQVWRNGARQARLARLLRDIKIEPITREDGYRAGELLGATRTKDVVDATIALLAKAKDKLYTSDPADLQKLCTATGFKAVVIGC
jgi:PIN domain